MQRFFQVTPPSVHQMVLSLEKAGLITRKPGRTLHRSQSWLRESEQSVEWIFCLTAARVLVANQEQR
jgi:DNA-binding MarR family transcriptional regulator